MDNSQNNSNYEQSNKKRIEDMDNFNETNETNRTNALQTLFYNEKEVRMAWKNGEPRWMLKDVCDAMKISNSRDVAKRLNKDDVDLIYVVDSAGRQQQMTMINEAALYSVILRSDKPEARKFEHWITHEVLPSIRRHGAYITTSKLEELMNDPRAWAKMLTTIAEEREEKERLQGKNENLQKQIETDRPKIVFADAVSVSENTVLIGELAKILKGNGIDIGQNRLFEQLRHDGFLIRRNGSDYNMPTQKAMELKLFKIKETAITHSDGHVSVSKTTKVTGRGQQFFMNYFLTRNGGENAAN